MPVSDWPRPGFRNDTVRPNPVARSEGKGIAPVGNSFREETQIACAEAVMGCLPRME